MEVYTRVFALDIAAMLAVPFTSDGRDAAEILRTLSTPRLLAVLGMRTISWTALLCQPALLAVHFGADGTQR